MEAFRRYADVAMEQARKMAEVRDLESLKTLTTDQAETLKTISEQVSADWKAWQDYANETREQLQQVFEAKPADNTAEKTPATGKGSNSKTAA